MKDATTELLLCAIKRSEKPVTAGDVTNVAMGLAIAEGWPPRTWKALTVKGVSRALQEMRDRGEILGASPRRENGRHVPAYTPVADAGGTPLWNTAAPMPAPPDPSGEDHPLHGRTKRQQYVIFDVIDTWLHTMARQESERFETVQRHHREMADLAARSKRDLLAAGIEVER